MKKIVPFSEYIKDPKNHWAELVGNTVILDKDYNQALVEYHIVDILSYKGQVFIKYTGGGLQWYPVNEIKRMGTLIGVLVSADDYEVPAPNLEDFFRDTIKHSPRKPTVDVNQQGWPSIDDSSDWNKEPILTTFD